MKYLVDVNVLSEATRPAPSSKVIAWLRQHEADLTIDAIILGEIRLGILLLPSGKRRNSLENWFEQGISRLYCLPWDATVAHEWANLLAKLRKKGKSMPLKDSMIAATAIQHNLTIATRNVSDFKFTNVPIINPFS
jgi:predicted nucleic acid-binding protein